MCELEKRETNTNLKSMHIYWFKFTNLDSYTYIFYWHQPCHIMNDRGDESVWHVILFFSFGWYTEQPFIVISLAVRTNFPVKGFYVELKSNVHQTISPWVHPCSWSFQLGVWAHLKDSWEEVISLQETSPSIQRNDFVLNVSCCTIMKTKWE